MGMEGTGSGGVAITPSNTVNITQKQGRFPRAVRFGTGGSCTYVTPDDSTLALTNIRDGETIPIDCKRINTTGLTGCADIVGIY